MQTKSNEIFDRSRELIPGGVNSPVRSFKSVGLTPFIVSHASGACIYDIDGNEYTDYVCSWGALPLGHANPEILDSVREAASRGLTYGAPTENEYLLANEISAAIPSMQMVRLVSSGTEAVMSAIRLARGFTGRDYIVKFDGCYHGHSDSVLIKAGARFDSAGIPDSAGVPEAFAKCAMTAPYNDFATLSNIFALHGDNIAAVIVEPIPGNMGLIRPTQGFLSFLRSVCDRYNSLLIFDEVISGFRGCYGGVQTIFDIKPDLTTLGNIIGGGMPLAAFGGRRDVCEYLAPLGNVYQAGTLSGNPVATAAGLKTLEILRRDQSIYKRLETYSKKFRAAALTEFEKKSIPVRINRYASLMTIFFTADEVTDFDSAKKSDLTKYASFFKHMLDKKIFLPPSQLECMFISACHSENHMELFVESIREWNI